VEKWLILFEMPFVVVDQVGREDDALDRSPDAPTERKKFRWELCRPWTSCVEQSS